MTDPQLTRSAFLLRCTARQQTCGHGNAPPACEYRCVWCVIDEASALLIAQTAQVEQLKHDNKELLTRVAASALSTVVVTVEGVGQMRVPQRATATRLQGFLPADMQVQGRILWRGDECFDVESDDMTEPHIELHDGDHLVFAPRGSYR